MSAIDYLPWVVCIVFGRTEMRTERRKSAYFFGGATAEAICENPFIGLAFRMEIDPPKRKTPNQYLFGPYAKPL